MMSDKKRISQFGYNLQYILFVSIHNLEGKLAEANSWGRVQMKRNRTQICEN